MSTKKTLESAHRHAASAAGALSLMLAHGAISRSNLANALWHIRVAAEELVKIVPPEIGKRKSAK